MLAGSEVVSWAGTMLPPSLSDHVTAQVRGFALVRTLIDPVAELFALDAKISRPTRMTEVDRWRVDRTGYRVPLGCI
jgi:hypothetical protein